MASIAFVTCRAQPAITEDDALVRAFLPPATELVAAPWDEPALDWAAFDAVVLRSPWDYHLRRREFERWLDRLAGAGARLWNPAALVRWNLEKTYLRALAADGLEVVPTRWIDAGAAVSLADLLARQDWPRAVVKPTVGASSSGLFVVERRRAREGQAHLERMLARGGAMIQPLLAEVVRRGEWSLVFLGGEPSHAVVKRAAAGEVRVQSDFGGSIHPAEPPPERVRWAERCLALAPADSLYARVDFVETAAGPLLMELELIEPQLFLATSRGAARRFAEALVARL